MINLLNTKAWALETNFFNTVSPFVLRRMMNGGDLSALIRKEEDILPKEAEARDTVQVSKNLYYNWEDGYHYKGEEEDTIIPRLRIRGGISKNGDLCSMGSSHMISALERNDAKKNVIGHILEIDSPGGEVDGTPELGNTIKNLTKPVISYVDGMAASAAYWLASQSNWIVTNRLNYTEVGSIGTLAVLVSEREWLKKEGLKVEIMRADKSKDKARLNSIEEWPKGSIEEHRDHLNLITEDFIGAVTSGRNGRLNTLGEDIFTGKMYDQERALVIGMIDQVGTIEDAISAVNHISKIANQT